MKRTRPAILILELALWAAAAGLALLAATHARGDWTASVCRIRAGRGLGTGAIFAQDATAWYILTNAHVAGRRGNRLQVEFFNAAGQQHPPLPGEVVWSQFAPHMIGYARDAAIVRVRRFPSFAPEILTLDDGSYPPAPGDAVLSCGCPEGRPPKLLQARIVAAGPQVFDFRPAGLPGRSGSPILSADGRRIIGLLTWGNDEQGSAQTAANIRAAFAGIRPRLGAWRRTSQRSYPASDPPPARLERGPRQWHPGEWHPGEFAEQPPPLVPIRWPFTCPRCGRGSTEADCPNCGPGGGRTGGRPGGGEFAPWEGPGSAPPNDTPPPSNANPPSTAGPQAPYVEKPTPGVTTADLAHALKALEDRLAAQYAAREAAPGPPGPIGPSGPPGEPGQPGAAGQIASLGQPPAKFADRWATGRFKGSDFLAGLAAAASAAVGLPPVAGWLAGKLASRGAARAETLVRDRSAAHHLTVDGPPPTVNTRQINQYVPLEINREGLAYSEALATYARAYPGSAPIVQSLERLKNQILAGRPMAGFSTN
ncbi:MAG: serine protease [Pirellulales bacterium]|nr:serine protease [Pirellulales bacterium]